ncbi:MAG TPA: hypothetical protein VH088_15450 [Terriglobales bacterium]|nr:hypothetical protein [Terriglobales bacterium]
MGNESDRRSLTWRLVEVLLSLLDNPERAIVRGDLAECSSPANQAMRDVLGLVLRRRLGSWTSWLKFAFVVLPISTLLSVFSRQTADLSSIYLWMYANNWHWADTHTLGFWQVLGETAFTVSLSLLALGCLAWSGGFIVGCLSETARKNGRPILLGLGFGLLLALPLHHDLHWTNDVVFANTFYREIFPLLVQAGCVVFPLLSGLRRGRESATRGHASRLVLLAIAIVALFSTVVNNPYFWILLKVRPWPSLGWPMQIIVFWPIAYLLFQASKERWSRVNTAS